MRKQFGTTLLGYKSVDTSDEIERIDSNYQHKEDELKKDIEKAKIELSIALDKKAQLQNRLNEYAEREKQITDMMIRAQINAQSIEANARNKARMMLESSEKELKGKLQELEYLRKKATHFKG